MAAAAAAVVVLPSSALGAGRCDGPEGTAAIEQFCESIPGPDRLRGFADRVGAGRPVPARTVAALEGSLDGKALLGHLIDTRIDRPKLQPHPARLAVRARSRQAAPPDDPVAAVRSALGSGAGLAASAFAALLLALLARSRARPTAADVQ